MPRRLPTFSLTIGFLAVALVIVPRARAEAGKSPGGDPASEFQRVVADPGGVDGVLQVAGIPLTVDVGTRVVDVKYIRRITFQRDPKEGHAQDTIELATKEIIRGRVTLDEFPVQSDDGTLHKLKKTELRELRVQRPKDLSLFAVLLGLLTLTAMEIVLGIDNVIFLAIIAGKLPPEQQAKARKIGLAAALGTRLLLLFSLSFLLGLTAPIFTLPVLPLLQDLEAREVSWRDIILLVGGLFLIGKSVFEMHEKMEHAKAVRQGESTASKTTTFAKAIFTIAVIDIVFSLDSVITAVGMVDADQVWVMITAMVIAMGVMLAFAGPISNFVDHHPTIKVLALAFLILIGVMLVAEGLGQHINKGYIYFAMAFGVGVEMVNMKLRGTAKKTAAATAELPPPPPA